jgi:hypothetical protein
MVGPPLAATDTYTAVNALNQYPSVSGAVWTDDTRGNQTGFSAGASTALAYDAENRLMSDSAASVTDPNGRRTAKSTGFITTTFAGRSRCRALANPAHSSTTACR